MNPNVFSAKILVSCLFVWRARCLVPSFDRRSTSKSFQTHLFSRGYSAIKTLSGFQYLLCVEWQRLSVSRAATSSNKKRSPASLKRSDTTLKILRACFALGYCTANVIKGLSSLWGPFIHRARDSDTFLISIMFFTWWPMALCVTSSWKSLLIRQMEQPPRPLPNLPSFSLFLTHTHTQPVTHSCKFNVHTCTQWVQRLIFRRTSVSGSAHFFYLASHIINCDHWCWHILTQCDGPHRQGVRCLSQASCDILPGWKMTAGFSLLICNVNINM